MGMVNEPEPAVFAMDEPEMVPSKALETTAAFAGPPGLVPVSAMATSMKN